MGKISVQGLEIYAYHGFFPEERKIGGKYIVDIHVESDVSEAVGSDNLSDTVNYADLAQIAMNEMKIKSKLIEHLAGRILDAIMDLDGTICWARVVVKKLNPPMGLNLQSVSVELEKSRS